jgi:hypothetical protein
MLNLLKDPNKDQLSGIANLCFDLSKASFIVVLLPTQNSSDGILQLIMSKLITIFIALAFTYAALVLLKLKENVK